MSVQVKRGDFTSVRVDLTDQYTTAVYDAKTGSKLGGVRSVVIKDEVNSVRVAIVEFILPEIIVKQ